MYPGIVEHRKIGHLDTGIKIFLKIICDFKFVSYFTLWKRFGAYVEHVLKSLMYLCIKT